MIEHEDRSSCFRMLARLAVSLRYLFDPFCEVIIHDFSDLESSIVCMEGNITGRSVGGAATDLILATVRSGDTDHDLHNYLTSLPGGRLMKSSTIFLRDESKNVYGAFCVNFDITAFTAVHKSLGAFVATEERGDVSEMLSDDPREIVQTLLTETFHEIYGANKPIISRESKVELMARLDQKGVFQLKKAVPILANLLDMSRATVYNYLNEARNGGCEPEQEETSFHI